MALFLDEPPDGAEDESGFLRDPRELSEAPVEVSILVEVGFIDAVEDDVDATVGKLVHIAVYLAAAVAIGDVVGVVPEEADHIEDLGDSASDGAIEGGGHALTGAAGEVPKSLFTPDPP